MSTKVILLTGAATNLGEAVARRLTHAGHTLVCTDTDTCGGEKLVQSLRTAPGQVTFLAADPTSSSDVHDLLRKIRARIAPLDAVVNTFWAAPAPGMMHNLDPDFLERTLGVTMRELNVAMGAQVRWFRDHGGGVILNTTSAEAQPAQEFDPHGLVTMTTDLIQHMSNLLAVDYAKDNIRVSSLSASSAPPGFTQGAGREIPCSYERAAARICETLMTQIDAVQARMRNEQMNLAAM